MWKVLRFVKRKLLPVIFLSLGMPMFAQEAGVSETLFNHVLNSSELDLFPFIPPINLPFGITVHQFIV